MKRDIKTILCMAVFLTFVVLNFFSASAESADSYYDIEPALMNVCPNSIDIMWEFKDPAWAAVEVSQNPSFPTNATIYHTTETKEILKTTINGLNENSQYYYRVSQFGTTDPTRIKNGSFYTSKPIGNRDGFSFILYGDTREDSIFESSYYGDTETHGIMTNAIKTHLPKAKFLVHLGDYGYSGRRLSWIRKFFQIEQNLLKDIPLLPVYGNHEFLRETFKGCPAPVPYAGFGSGQTDMDSYLMPPPGAAHPFYYSYAYGNIQIIVIQTGTGDNDNSEDLYDENSEQYNFVRNTLISASNDPRIDHIFVAMHYPMYSAGKAESANLQFYYEDMFKYYGVKAVFQACSHDYQHLSKDGIHYLVSGGGGAPIDLNKSFNYSQTQAQVHKAEAIYHFISVEVTGQTVCFKTYKITPINPGAGTYQKTLIEQFCL